MAKLKTIFKMKSKVIRIRDGNYNTLKEAAIKESLKRGQSIRPSQLADEIIELFFKDYVDLDRDTFRFEESILDKR